MTCSGAWPIASNSCAEARGLYSSVRLPLLIACHPLSRNELITTCASLRPELKELMPNLEGLTQAACPGLRQSYGIGIGGAAVLLAAVGDNPERTRLQATAGITG